MKKILYALGKSIYFVVVFILVGIPLIICFINSFRSLPDILKGFIALPKEITLDNYIYIITERNILHYMGNSLIVTVIGLAISFVITPFVSYMIAINWNKKQYRLLYIFLASCMFIPGNLIVFPLIKMYYNLHLMNIGGLIIYNAVIFIPENVFMLVPYFRTFDKEIGSAAQLDGCNSLQLYYHVFLPMCMPYLITVMILNTVWMWNDFFMPLMILNRNPDTWTLPVFIYNYLGRNSFQKNYAFASCQIALIPIIVFYACFHKKIINGLNMRMKG